MDGRTDDAKTISLRLRREIKITFSYVTNIHARVMVLKHNTLSECALQMYEVWLKYL